eukprot:352153-Chlamydomonas_euryale.AAC.1
MCVCAPPPPPRKRSTLQEIHQSVSEDVVDRLVTQPAVAPRRDLAPGGSGAAADEVLLAQVGRLNGGNGGKRPAGACMTWERERGGETGGV